MSAPVLATSGEQEELRDSVRRFLAVHSSEDAVRTLMVGDAGYDPEVWSKLCGQLGAAALAIPTEYGGSGYGFAELAIVLEEMGRALTCAPLLATAVLATGALLESGDADACRAHLPAIAEGTTIATMAAEWGGVSVDLAAEQRADRWLLNGHAGYVLDGVVADLILVTASTGGSRSLFAVDAGASGLVRRSLATLDLTRKLADLDFRETPARLVGNLGAGDEIAERVLHRVSVGLAAEQVGGAQRVLDAAVDYASSRVQFGVPIGSFQAIKHLCADVLVAVESARSTARYAAWALDAAEDDIGMAASMAKACCSEAFTAAAMANLQVHGGVGFTWEDATHLYLKRAKSTEVLFGSPGAHRALVAEHLGLRNLVPPTPATVLL